MAEAVILKKILEELMENAKQIRQEELEQFADKIQEGSRIFVAGAGRSGFVARAFSNRLMHLGLTVYFVGEPTTPSIQKGDLLVIVSGSGETGSLKVQDLSDALDSLNEKAREKFQECTCELILVP